MRRQFLLTTICFIILGRVVSAQSSPVQSLEYAQLHGEFTLVYTSNYKYDSPPKQQAAAALKGVSHQERVTFSARDGKILFKRQGKDSSDVYIYDGEKTYQYSTLSKRVYVRPGLESQGWNEVPLPAVGLPYIPLIKSPATKSPASNSGVLTNSEQFTGSILMLRGSGLRHALVYAPGQVTATHENNRLKILTASVEFMDIPLQKWEFLEHRLFKETWLASHLKWTRYQYVGDPEKIKNMAQSKTRLRKEDLELLRAATVPDMTYEHHLVNASTTALEKQEFDIATYLKKGTIVEDNNGKNVLSFEFDPDGGNLDRQRQRREVVEQVVSDKAGRSKKDTTGGIGLFLLAALLMVGTWFLWRRR